MEIKQHTLEQPMCQRRNHKEIRKYLEADKNENHLTACLKELEKEKRTKHKVSRRNKIINIRVEINEIKAKKNSNRRRQQN